MRSTVSQENTGSFPGCFPVRFSDFQEGAIRFAVFGRLGVVLDLPPPIKQSHIE
jgi:hypothetical protein